MEGSQVSHNYTNRIKQVYHNLKYGANLRKGEGGSEADTIIVKLYCRILSLFSCFFFVVVAFFQIATITQLLNKSALKIARKCKKNSIAGGAIKAILRGRKKK